MATQVLSLVVAYTIRTRAIGLRGLLPWPPLSQDTSRLKALTTNHSVIIGRRTFETDLNSIPLPSRRNIILSSSPAFIPPPGVVHASDWNEALLLAEEGFGGGGYDDGTSVHSQRAGRPVFVLGGAAVYAHALRCGDVRMVFATEIEADFPGDRFFPELPGRWRRLEGNECTMGWAREEAAVDNGVRFRFVTYERQV